MKKQTILKCYTCDKEVKVGKYQGGNPTYKCGTCKNLKIKEKVK